MSSSSSSVPPTRTPPAYTGDYSGLGFEALDPLTVKVTIDQPVSDPLFLAKFANYAGGFIVSKKAIEAMGEDWIMTNPVGTGPFKFESYEPRQKVVFTDNPKYFRGAPALKKVTAHFMPDTSSREFRLQTGELHIDALKAGILCDNNIETAMKLFAGAGFPNGFKTEVIISEMSSSYQKPMAAIQAQVVNLLENLRAKFQLTYLSIAHDLSMVKHISNRVAVMYLCKIVEVAETSEIYRHPLYPYTEVLLSAVPAPHPNFERNQIVLKGDVPSPINPPSGGHFRTRCPFVEIVCNVKEPALIEVSPGHAVACHVVCGPNRTGARKFLS